LVKTSYRLCRRIARRAGSNFYPCFWMLRGAKRQAMDALYAFMRHTDDLGDNLRPVAVRREQLCEWRAALEAAVSGGLKPSLDDSAADILPAVADTVDRFGIPVEHLLAVIEGVETDLDDPRFETFDRLAEYCHRVASAVGLACIHIWGFRGQAAFAPVRQCGLAFQMTNILRDLKEDARLGRAYLPAEDLRRWDYSTDDLAAAVADDRFRGLMNFEIARVEDLFRRGAVLFDYLDPDGRRIFGMMTAVYHRLLEQIKADPTAVLRGRVRLGRIEKLGIASRWLLLPPRRPGWGVGGGE
jgi:phytoene synthase